MNAVRKPHAGLVGDITRLRDNDFVAGIQHGAAGEIDALRTADRHRNLAERLIGDAEAALNVACNLLAELIETRIARVEGATALQRINTFFPDGPGRVKVRLADAEGDGSLHGADNVEKLPDAGGLQGNRLLR